MEFVHKSKSEGKPYMLIVNFPDAHLPFQNDVEGLPTVKVDTSKINSTLPFVGVNTYRLRKVTAVYYNCMNRLDESIGMLLDSIGDLSNTCIIYISDHGAQFTRSKIANDEGGLYIHFIIHWPDRIKNKGIVMDELVSVIDILPTVLEIAGSEVAENLPGLSLLNLLSTSSNTIQWRKYLGADGEGASPDQYFPIRSIRGERYKLILNIEVGRKEFPVYSSYASPKQAHGANTDEIMASGTEIQEVYKTWKNPPEWELYDLEKDPWEFENLSGDPDYKDILNEMQGALLNWRSQTNDPFLDKNKLNKFTKEMDSINQLYPEYTYRKIENFRWKYPDYLNK